MQDTLARPRPWPRLWPAAACASLFFLGTADLLFAVRTHGVTLRLAQLALLAGLIVWWRTQRVGFAEDLRSLLIAWAPFAGVFVLAAMLSEDPLPGLLKLAWFGFNFGAAYAWCQLFRRDDLALGYFSAYLLVAVVIVLDFFIGFGAGPAHMIGYAQSTYGVPERDTWFRPHAFYYEPSYAAAGLALAWALSLSTLSAYAPKVSAAVAVTAVTALAVTFSRTGWVYAFVAMAAIVAIGGNAVQHSLRRRVVYVVAGGVVLLAFAMLLVPPQSRGGVATLLQALGVQATAERVCPIVDSWFPSLDLQCLEGVARTRALPYNQPGEPPEKTSEGGRLMALASTLERIGEHPFTGEGVVRRTDKLISPTVPNTWLELAVEGGLLALVAFAWGLAVTIYRWDGLRPENRTVGIVLLLYFLVSWQFIQTFPRLDQWLSLWMALTVARGPRADPVRRGEPA